MTSNVLSKLNPAAWGAITLAALTATIGGLTIAHAGASPDTLTSCHSISSCIGGKNSGAGPGVQGLNTKSGTGPGVLASANHSNGSVSISNDSAPSTFQEGAAYANATSSTGPNGSYAFAEGRNGGFFENGNSQYYTLFAYADLSGAFPLGAVNATDGGFLSMDSVGDLSVSGAMYATSFNPYLRTRDGQHVASFASQSASAELSDSGTAQIFNGRGTVQLDPMFTRTLDIRSGYHVFLTPMGDSRGLYVASKSPGGFEVRESQGGRSTLSFDYRITGRPAGASGAHLPITRLKTQFTKAPGHVPM